MSESMMGEHSPCGKKQRADGGLYMEDEKFGVIELLEEMIDAQALEQAKEYIRSGQNHGR